MLFTWFVPPDVWLMLGQDKGYEKQDHLNTVGYQAVTHIPYFARKEADALYVNSVRRKLLRTGVGGDWFVTDGRTDIKKPLPLGRQFVTRANGETEVCLMMVGQARELTQKDRGLFLTFAQLPVPNLRAPVFDEVEAFILQYGLLGGDLSRLMTPPRGQTQAEVIIGESLVDWTSEILEMRHALELWQALKAKNTPSLARFISWERVTTDREVTYVSRLRQPDLEHFDEDAPLIGVRSERWRMWPVCVPEAQLIWSLAPGHADDVRAGWCFLQLWINHGLIERTATQLGKNAKSKLLFVPTPTSFIGALWHQFANAVVGNDEIRICPVCSKSFSIQHAVSSRSDKTYCSGRCRVRAHRLRGGSKVKRGSA